MAKKILVADLLCGAGGSSTGCQRALEEMGLKMELVCVNHWGTAIETHKKNHPEARHYVQDISTVRPHLIVPEGYLDLLMASPTCTHHSVARGGKPTSDQQRSDPWHIITWMTELRIKRIIIENVWEFCGWGPVDPRTGKPIKSRKGEYFHAWIETIKRLGFEPGWRKLNAADYGDATTRQRFILMARSDGRKVHWPVPTHARKPDGLSLFPSVQPWRPAREIIDFRIRGKSIFNRKKPLAPKTLARIYAGVQKFNWPEPFLVILRNHMAAQSLDQPLPTIAAEGQHIGIAEPFIATVAHGNEAGERDPNYRRAKSIQEPLGAIHGTGNPFAVVEPFILNRHGDGYGETRAHSLKEPAPTTSCRGAGYLVEPFVLASQSDGAPRSLEEPTPTGTTTAPPALVSPYYSHGSGETCRPDSEPLPSPTTKGRFGLIVPITHQGGPDRVKNSNADPLPTITTANRGELAFVAAQFGEAEGQAPRVHSLDEPASTGMTLGHGALVEGLENYDIMFRMLEPHELAAAMGFNTEEAQYEFAGTKTEQIKQIGNAVSVRKMKACVGAIMADAAPKRKAPNPINIAAE